MKYLMLLVFLVCSANAAEIEELDRWKPVIIAGVNIVPDNEAVSIYSDIKIHKIGGRRFFLLIQGFESRLGHPLGQCGTGHEIFADIYQLEAKKAVRVQRVMIASCWRTLDLDSWQNKEDFSSIAWDRDGVIFDWVIPPKFTNLRAQLKLNAVSPELVFIP